MKATLILVAIILITPCTSFAKTQLSVGLGYQHASVLGIQYGVIEGVNKYYGAVGLSGVAVGYQRAIDVQKKHTIGVVIGKESLSSEDGFALFTYNYHFTAQDISGWQLGVSAGVRREDEGSFFSNVGKTSTKGAVFIDVSYKF